MVGFQLAQLNIATMREPLESPSMADFVANLERINALAEQSPGFVWRLKDDEGDATSLRPFGETMIVNMSVWQDIESPGLHVQERLPAARGLITHDETSELAMTSHGLT